MASLSPIFTHIWQSTLFAAVAAVVAFALRKNRAQVRYCVWLTASLKFVVPFSMFVALGNYIPWASSARPDVSMAVRQIARPLQTIPVFFHAPLQATPEQGPIPILLLAVWLLGFFAVLLRWGQRWLRIRAAMLSAVPLYWQTPIPALETAALMEPGVFGIFSPVLLLPTGIKDHLTEQHLEPILAHELCHVRRRDNLAAALHMLIECLFWFHPIVWWIGGRLVEERERACDEDVLQLGNQPEVYAESILKVCQFYLESPLVCVAGITGADLKQRMVRIMTERLSVHLSLQRKVMLAAVGTAAIALPLTFGLTYSDVERFEVASIKPMRSTGDMEYIRFTHGGVSAKNVSLALLINYCFDGIPDEEQILSAPKWVFSTKYAVEAKPPVGDIDYSDPSVPAAQRDVSVHRTKARLKLLLEDRFQLKTHTQTRDVKGYALVIGKQGAKFLDTRLPDGTPGGLVRANGAGQLAARSITMPYLANWIGRSMGVPVRDKTGLTGFFRIDLSFTPDNAPLRIPGEEAAASPAPDMNGPSIFTAVQKQLGLQLVAETQTGLQLFIDHVEKPSEN